jgi:DNA-binding PadR family transcriptional regulator
LDSSVEVVRDHADTIILNILYEKDRYGYEIIDLIEARSHGKYSIKQPTLYNALKRLEKQGFISAYFGDESGGGRRKYYTLTPKGIDTLSQVQSKWEFSRTILDTLLSDKAVDLATAETPYGNDDFKPATKRVKIYDDGFNLTNSEKRQTIDEVDRGQFAVESNDLSNSNTANPCETSLSQAQINSLFSFKPQEEVLTTNDLDKREKITDNRDGVNINNADRLTSHISHLTSEKSAFEPFSSRIEPKIEPKSDEYDIHPAFLSSSQEKTANTVADLRWMEKQTAAAKLLKIGEFSEGEGEEECKLRLETAADDALSYSAYLNSALNPARVATPKPQTPYPYATGKPENYKDKLAAMFRDMEDEDEDYAESYHPENAIAAGKTRQFSELKQSLYEEGYKLRTYSKSNSQSQYYMNSIYYLRMLRDTALLTWLVMVISLLVLFVARSVFEFNATALLVIGLVSLILPIASTAIWASQPAKKKKAKFNFKSSLLSSFIAYVVIVLICVLIMVIAPSIEVSFARGRVYAPFILALFAPASVFIYNLLYKTKNYHAKN